MSTITMTSTKPGPNGWRAGRGSVWHYFVDDETICGSKWHDWDGADDFEEEWSKTHDPIACVRCVGHVAPEFLQPRIGGYNLTPAFEPYWRAVWVLRKRLERLTAGYFG